uniref:High potential iron-sulfur proteins family profile domain-containing protein n=1 Tax=uncultured bacterium 5G4 TaxID=1701326 RepID=A0A166H3F9_9BACT|nr:hypothetical protein 5G4_027 [uncultured bacterium 5G4]
MAQSTTELKKRAEEVDLSAESTNDDICGNCKYYQEMTDGIGYCAHRQVDMVVGEPWWCKLWEPDKETEAARKKG